MQCGFNFYKQFITLLIILSFATSMAFGQKKAVQGKSATTCSGAWTGNITYSKSMTMTDNKTVERVSNRGKDKKKSEIKYRYKASVAVFEAPEKNGQNVGKASIEHKFSLIDQTSAEEKNSCDKGETWQVMKGEFETKTEARGQATNQLTMVYVSVNSDGSYSVGIGLPPIQGLSKGEEKATYSGQCKPKEGKNIQMPETPTEIEGNSFQSSGNNRIDPKDPNNLSGSWSETNGNMTETITWSLQKCGENLRITDLQFEDMKFPNWNDWQDVSEQRGTTDGNFVKIKAKILNTSGETKYADLRFKETYKGDKWDGAKPDAPLEESVRSVRIDANTEQTVEMLWDSSGYSWFDDGRPRLIQRIKAELTENNKKIDEKIENLKVFPKPVVLVHGIWSNWSQTWLSWQNILTTSHSYDWKAFPVGEKPEKGVMNTATASYSESAYQLSKYIQYAQEDRNAWHVDIVAHSTGGLVARNYINSLMPTDYEDGRPQISHLLMLGTPNLGSPCADSLSSSNPLFNQVTTEFVANFNRQNTNRKGVKFSALAGDVYPAVCYKFEGNDGFTTVSSAHWTVKDSALSKSSHKDLTGTIDFTNFVKPRLAIGPKGNHNPDIPLIPVQTGEH